MDIPDLPEVILFGGITSLSVLIQRTGRPARETGSIGKAIVYVKKTDIASAKAYMRSDEGCMDDRLLITKDPQSHVQADTSEDAEPPNPSPEDGDSDTNEEPDGTDEVAYTAVSQSTRTTAKKGNKSRPLKTASSPRIRASYRLLVAAYIQHLCLIRQINMIYTNPGTEKDCAHCSSCQGDIVPEPRTLYVKPISDSPSAAVISGQMQPNSENNLSSPDVGTKIPGYMKLKAKDIDELTSYLKKAMQKMRWNGSQRREEALFISINIFLPLAFTLIHRILQNSRIEGLRGITFIEFHERRSCSTLHKIALTKLRIPGTTHAVYVVIDEEESTQVRL